MRISTGAAIPDGADAVVRVEDAEIVDGELRLESVPSPGANIRRAGEDLRAGQRAVPAGTRIGSAELALLASAGVAEIPCRRRPVVSIVVTGDELVPPREPLGPGQIHESNGRALAALVTEAGGRVGSVVRIGDRRDGVAKAIRSALDADVAIASGGISVGEHDHVRAAFREEGAEEVFWRVAFRPGKPTWFGTRGGTLAFGLPGNPVSAIVCFEVFVRPALDLLLGRADRGREAQAVMDAPHRKRPGRAEALRGRLRVEPDGWHFEPLGTQGSHQLTSIAGADALALVPADSDGLDAGERVRVLIREERWR
jgi:molybdopterin molybdotransferase